MAKVTYFNTLKVAVATMKAAHKDPEGLWYVFLERQHWSRTDYLVHQQDDIPQTVAVQLQKDVQALLQDEPPQYLVGHAYFYGELFQVDPRVLIPRYDTETLVQWVLDDFSATSKLAVLDIGTGSGILAETLKKKRSAWQVFASDISANALAVAKINALNLKTQVIFIQSDLFANIHQQFDLIVSNPPYIADSEKAVMDASVLKFEPKQALFAKHSGLQFYQRFFSQVVNFLQPNGVFYVEFGYQQKQALVQLANQLLPEFQISFHQDLSGHDRVMKAQKQAKE